MTTCSDDDNTTDRRKERRCAINHQSVTVTVCLSVRLFFILLDLRMRVSTFGGVHGTDWNSELLNETYVTCPTMRSKQSDAQLQSRLDAPPANARPPACDVMRCQPQRGSRDRPAGGVACVL